jgi:hypothetical protein
MNSPPAFPGKQKALLIKSEHSDIAKEYEIDQNGMTLRDYFAAKAMPVAMETLRQDWTKDDGDSWYWNKTEIEMLAEKSYALADLMLKAREQNAT